MSAPVVWAGSVGKHRIEWLTVPRGESGTASVKINGKGPWVIRWKRDREGIAIELPGQLSVLSLAKKKSDEGTVTLSLNQRIGDAYWSTLRWLDAGEEAALAGQQSQGKKKNARVRAQMPGKIVRVLVQVGQEVEVGQPLIVMEAMKMENEIRSVSSGRIKEVKVLEGQAVESGADLLSLE